MELLERADAVAAVTVAHGSSDWARRTVSCDCFKTTTSVRLMMPAVRKRDGIVMRVGVAGWHTEPEAKAVPTRGVAGARATVVERVDRPVVRFEEACREDDGSRGKKRGRFEVYVE